MPVSSPAFWLAIAMATLAVVNATLMLAWLWRYPMRADPSGRRPQGVTSAPRAGLWLHRVIGWSFVLTWLAVAALMLPRLWLHREFSALGLLHGVLGLAVGLLLVAKIIVLRRMPRLEHRMPWFGGGLVVLTLLTVTLALAPWWRIGGSARTNASATVPSAIAAVVANCLQCHGASIIADEHEDLRKWRRLVAEMQERALRRGRTPIRDTDAEAIARWLAHVRPEHDDDGDDDDGHQRRRRRGRDD